MKFVLLATLLLPLALRAQTPDDSLKGRIWTATAVRIWADTKPRAPLPPAWPTNAAFNEWLGTQGKGEKSGIGLLRGDVVRTLGPGHPATAAQVAQAILAEAGNPPRSRRWLQKLDLPVLQTALQQLVPVGTAPAATAAAAGPGAPVLATNDSTMAPPLPAATGALEGTNVGFFGRNPVLAGLLGALLGALLTYGLLRSLRRRSRSRPHNLATPFATHATPQESTEVLRLQNEVQRLAAYIKGLEAKLLHYENTSAADTALGPESDPDSEPTLAPPVPPAELPHEPVPPAGNPAAPAPDAAPHP